MWENTVDSDDLLCHERKFKEFNVRIEARKNVDSESKKWEIFRTYYNDTSLNYTEEFFTTTRDKAEALIETLMRDKLLTNHELTKIKLEQRKGIKLNINRVFKDYNVEKWIVCVNHEKEKNVVYIRDAEMLEIDFIMNEKYKHIMKKVSKEFIKILGYNNSIFDKATNVYYFKEKTERYSKASSKNILVSKVEVGLDYNSDENID